MPNYRSLVSTRLMFTNNLFSISSIGFCFNENISWWPWTVWIEAAERCDCGLRPLLSNYQNNAGEKFLSLPRLTDARLDERQGKSHNLYRDVYQEILRVVVIITVVGCGKWEIVSVSCSRIKNRSYHKCKTCWAAHPAISTLRAEHYNFTVWWHNMMNLQDYRLLRSLGYHWNSARIQAIKDKRISLVKIPPRDPLNNTDIRAIEC